MNDNDRVAERRIDLSLPIVEGSEEMPDLTADILARLRAEGMLPRRPRRTWIAAALVVLGIGVALGVALQGLGGTAEEEEAAVADAGELSSLPIRPLSQEPGSRTPIKGGRGGNSWFDATELDLGTVFQHEQATGTFAFRNPTGETVQLTGIRQSCSCTKAVFRIGGEEYSLITTSGSPTQVSRVHPDGALDPGVVNSIPVAPGAEGTIEVEMEMNGIRGLRSASLTFETTDPDLPFVRLSFVATGATYFVVEPEEIDLGAMFWNEKREFTARVTSPILKDFNILRHDTPPDGMQVGYKKNMLEDGDAEYTITGTYGPISSGSGGKLVFHTEYEGLSFSLPVLAQLEGPLRLTPGSFLSLGRIPEDRGASLSVTLEPTQPFELRVLGLEARELSFDEKFLQLYAEHKDGAVEITVKILPGIESGTVVRGDILVHTSHPGAPQETILFNGFVR